MGVRHYSKPDQVIFLLRDFLVIEAMASDTRPPVKNGKVREKIGLQPGFHLADWMRLSNAMQRKDSGGMKKISLAELSQHRSEFDCWTAYKGKVYDITQYIAYHPGGKPKLMLGAGKDCTELFDRYHRWVNIDSILSKCVVGLLGSEDAPIREGEEGDEDEETKMRDSAVEHSESRATRTMPSEVNAQQTLEEDAEET